MFRFACKAHHLYRAHDGNDLTLGVRARGRCYAKPGRLKPAAGLHLIETSLDRLAGLFVLKGHRDRRIR